MGETRRSRPPHPGPPITTFTAAWQLTLEDAAKSPKTVHGYIDSLRSLCRCPSGDDIPAVVEDVDSPHNRAYLIHEEQTMSSGSAAHHYRNIRVFFGWLASEGERENPNPMDRVEAPKVTKKAQAFFAEDEPAALLKTCSGSSFVDRRATAIMRIFIDTGIRVSGLAGLRYSASNRYTRWSCGLRHAPSR